MSHKQHVLKNQVGDADGGGGNPVTGGEENIANAKIAAPPNDGSDQTRVDDPTDKATEKVQ